MLCVGGVSSTMKVLKSVPEMLGVLILPTAVPLGPKDASSARAPKGNRVSGGGQMTALQKSQLGSTKVVMKYPMVATAVTRAKGISPSSHHPAFPGHVSERPH